MVVVMSSHGHWSLYGSLGIWSLNLDLLVRIGTALTSTSHSRVGSLSLRRESDGERVLFFDVISTSAHSAVFVRIAVPAEIRLMVERGGFLERYVL
jgi:hypothetical protein